MNTVSKFRPIDTTDIDPARLNRLASELGTSAMDAILTRALEDLAARLADLDLMYRRGDMAALAKGARGLIGIASEIGMVSLARIAGHVADTAGRGDYPALAATRARMKRVGDRSLTKIWDVRDMMT